MSAAAELRAARAVAMDRMMGMEDLFADQQQRLDQDAHGSPRMSLDVAPTELIRFNAIRHAVLSRHTVLPWEDAREYHGLVAALTAEHSPRGPTEEHLVEELAGVMWRKRRLRLAEAAAHHRGLQQAIAPYRETGRAALAHLRVRTAEPEGTADAVHAPVEETEGDCREVADEAVAVRRVLDRLDAGGRDAYRRALVLMPEQLRNEWRGLLARDPGDQSASATPRTPDARSLRHFLESEVLAWCERRQRDLANRQLIREQAFGEALDPEPLERLSRYEIHLDRKFERTLSMLLRLQDLRRQPVEG